MKVGDFWAVDDFIIVYKSREAYTHIILGRRFLTTSSCKINVKGGRLTFSIGKCHVAFNFFEDRITSPSSFISDKLPISHDIETDDVWCRIDPSMFD